MNIRGRANHPLFATFFAVLIKRLKNYHILGILVPFIALDRISSRENLGFISINLMEKSQRSVATSSSK